MKGKATSWWRVFLALGSVSVIALLMGVSFVWFQVGRLDDRFKKAEPVTRMVLPDGKELRLACVTYGTEHHVAGAGQMADYMNFLAKLGSSRRAPYRAEYGYRFPEPCVLLWFTVFDPKTNALELRPLATAELMQSSASPVPLERYPMDQWPMPNETFVVNNYDRRQPTFHVQVTVQRKTFDLEVANPVAGVTFPEWKPEPLPQARRAFGLDLALSSVSISDPTRLGRLQVTPEFSLKKPGDEGPGMRRVDGLIVETQGVDATGNVVHAHGTSEIQYDPLPFREKAWKIQATLSRNKDFQFASNEGLVLGPVPMPAEGKASAFAVPESEAKERLRFVALVGPGRFVWEEATLVETGLTVAEMKARGPTPDMTQVLDFTTPHLVLLFDYFSTPPRSMKWLDLRNEMHVRQRLGERSVGLEPGWSPRVISLKFGQLAAEHQYWFRWEDPSPPGTPVMLQIIRNSKETVEFVFTPPKEEVGARTP
jgi:hypothetical protein